jgi:hypothetical protein
MWISVNPATEKEEIVQAAMALSGWYELGWSECGEYLNYPPLVGELLAEEIANLYNNADNLGLNIYCVGHIEANKNSQPPLRK